VDGTVPILPFASKGEVPTIFNFQPSISKFLVRFYVVLRLTA
jgi:hypothetical protein